MELRFLSVLIRNKNYKALPDEELIRLFRANRNTEIIHVLFDRYVHLVFSNCLRFLKNEDRAKDATMQLFEMLPDKLCKHTINHFKSWFFRVICNHCLMELRRSKREILTDIKETLDLKSFAGSDEYFQDEEEYAEEKIVQYLEDLGENQKVCVKMLYLQQHSYKEIAVMTGFTLKQVKSFIQNGIRNLKIALDSRHEKS